jgi:hypothetical protein
MSLDDHILKMMTCHHDVHCQNEKHCFEVAQYAHACRSKERLQQSLNQANQSLDLEEVIEYFVPPLHWEAHLPPRWVK